MRCVALRQILCGVYWSFEVRSITVCVFFPRKNLNIFFLVDLRKSDYVVDAPVVLRVLPSTSSKKYVTGVPCASLYVCNVCTHYALMFPIWYYCDHFSSFDKLANVIRFSKINKKKLFKFFRGKKHLKNVLQKRLTCVLQKRLTCVLQKRLTSRTNLFNHKSNHHPYTVTHAFNQPETRCVHILENIKGCRQVSIR